VANIFGSNVSVLTNNGDGTFAAAVNYAVQNMPQSVYGADLDGDGDCDLAVANAESNSVSIFINNTGPYYLCGDANGDGDVNIGDAVYLINYVFNGGSAPDPLCAGNVNGDGDTNVGDAVYLINYVFKSGPAPVEPCCP
jgi:hypothetical protein